MLPLRLSIVMCTYNGAAYLQAQLDSLLAQACLPDEIVISDDASTDASMTMLDAFALRAGDPRRIRICCCCTAMRGWSMRRAGR